MSAAIAPAAARPPSARVPSKGLGTVLVVDDDELLRRALSADLAARGLEALGARSLADARQVLATADVDVVLLDEQLPDGRGHTLCELILATRPATKIVFMTAFPEFEHALTALRAGAFDYLPKPFELEALRHCMRRCFETLRLERVERRERLGRDREAGALRLVGASKAFDEVRHLVEVAGRATAPVLVTGETGTGKSHVAKAIHYAGVRRGEPFVALSCGALPDHLVEGELFGWERGAFTGAVAARDGAFEMADRGTLFLDEIGELPVHLQPKLLGALEDRAVRRLGGRSPRPIDTRIIAATNAHLPSQVAAKRFRGDLYYRLAVLEIRLPPLRDRRDDIPTLASHLLGSIGPCGGPPPFAAGELERLQAYDWPGNVRELRNVLERALLLQRAPLRPSSLLAPPQSGSSPPAGGPSVEAAEAVVTLDQIERRHIEQALRTTGGNLAQAARLLGISLSTLKRRRDRDKVNGSF